MFVQELHHRVIQGVPSLHAGLVRGEHSLVFLPLLLELIEIELLDDPPLDLGVASDLHVLHVARSALQVPLIFYGQLIRHGFMNNQWLYFFFFFKGWDLAFVPGFFVGDAWPIFRDD